MIMFYFSGTGNSRYVANLFSQTMNIDCHSIEEEMDFSKQMATEDTIGFCFPVHGSRVPRIMRKFATRYLEQLKGKKLIILCTQMIFSGDGARAFTDVFPRGFIDVVYAEHIIMPNNVCNLFFLPLQKEKTVRKCVVKADKQVQRICDEIKIGRIRRRGFNPLSQALGLIQGVFYPGFERGGLDRVWMDNDCETCLLCVTACPMKNIQYENDRLTTRNDCTICCRCINICPQKAIAIYLHTKVKRQYKGVDARGIPRQSP